MRQDQGPGLGPAAAPAPKLTNTDGTPAPTNPSYALSTPGPAKIGVPNFFIDKFRIPPFLLPIYQAAGMQYGIRWEILAGINEIETDYGRNLNVSSAGALGWMQFMPATWKAYGVDANQDGVKDPFNPVDAIFAAARYLKAAGADKDLRKGIFAYNHADWYVDSVLMRAQVIGGIPGDLVGSLTGLTQGRFPVRAKATYAGALKKADRKTKGANAAVTVESDETRRNIEIYAKAGSPVIAVNDGKVAQARHEQAPRPLRDRPGRLRQHVHLRAPRAASPRPTRRPKRRTKKDSTRRQAPRPRRATRPSTSQGRRQGAEGRGRSRARRADRRRRRAAAKVRLFAHPTRKNALANGGDAQVADARPPRSSPPPAPRSASTPRTSSPSRSSRAPASSAARRSAASARRPRRKAPHLLFEIRPAGRGAPRIDPKPILDGWKLLECTEVYRAKGKNALFGSDAERAARSARSC